jgi:hypothetical protein
MEDETMTAEEFKKAHNITEDDLLSTRIAIEQSAQRHYVMNLGDDTCDHMYARLYNKSVQRERELWDKVKKLSGPYAPLRRNSSDWKVERV